MEIHSSSLSTSYAGSASKNTHKEQLRSTQVNKENTQPTLPLLLPQPNEIESIINKSDYQQLIEPIEKLNSPTDFTTARALRAYTQENSQSLISQHSEFISRIDFFA